MKIKTICRKDKTDKNGTSPLFIRFTGQRQSKFVSIELSVEPCYWDFDAQMLTADCPDRRTLQSQIDSTLETYHKKIKRLEALEVDVNFDTLFETNGRKATVTVEDGFRAEIERLESLGKYSSAGKHRSALLALNAYHPARIALEVIDIDYLKGFEMFLRKRGNKNNINRVSLRSLGAKYVVHSLCPVCPVCPVCSVRSICSRHRLQPVAIFFANARCRVHVFRGGGGRCSLRGPTHSSPVRPTVARSGRACLVSRG